VTVVFCKLQLIKQEKARRGMVNCTILRSLLVTSCLLALSQACKKKQAPQFKEYEEDNRTIKEYEEVNRTINLLEGDIFVDFDVQFNDTDKPDEEIMIKPKALIISGGEGYSGEGGEVYSGYSVGNSVEVYIPSTGQHCQLPDLPGDPRDGHTMEEMTVCGGFVTSTGTSCLTLIDGTWQTTTTLLEERDEHSSWASPSGVILLGGEGSPRTSERIQEDGTSVSGFTLEHSLLYACAINLGSTVILTGGADYYNYNRVSEYSESGFTRDLPQLQQGRCYHGCSYFENEAGTKTFLVTGGWSGDGYNDLSSTELLVENSAKWIYSGELPTPRDGLRGANIDQRVIMTGGREGDYHVLDDILEFNPSAGTWILVDRMMSAKEKHAVSVISSEEIIDYC